MTRADLIKLLEELVDDYLSDPFLRLHTATPVRHVAGIPATEGGNPIVIASIATDVLVPTPAKARSVTLYWPAHGTPTDGIQGYYSTSAPWHANPEGVAYDAGSAAYVGAPVAQNESISFDLDFMAGPIHVASPVAGTHVYIGFTA